MNKKLIYLAMAAVWLSSCSSDEAPVPTPGETLTPAAPTVMVLTASIGDGETTRGAQDVQTTSFDVGELINVECTPSGGTMQATVYRAGTADSDNRNELTPYSRALTWPSKGTVSLRAYYPSTVSSSQTSFSVQPDQSATDNSTYKESDLMYAVPVIDQAKTSSVPLTFRHALSKVVINLTAGTGLTDEDLSNCAVAVKACRSVDITNGVADASTASDIDWIPIGTGAATAGIIVPQTIDGSITPQPFVRVSLAGRDYFYKFTICKTFAERMKYTYTLTVNHGGEISLIKAEITDWMEEIEIVQNI
jgi:hypothetical protein